MVMSSLVMTASIVAQGTPGHRVGPRSCARSIGERLAQWQTAAAPGLPRARRDGGILALPATEGAACANDPGPASRPKSSPAPCGTPLKASAAWRTSTAPLCRPWANASTWSATARCTSGRTTPGRSSRCISSSTRAPASRPCARPSRAPACQGCVWWQTLPAATPAPDLRQAWEQEAEAEAGFFGRALLEDGAVVGWMHTAAARLLPRARCLPAGPPSPDAYVLTCSHFYDEEYLRGFQFLLQEIEASLKHRRVAALEAFGLSRARPGDPFRGYIRELNLFHPEVLQGGGFRRVQSKGEIARFRLDLATLVETPRHSVAWERVEAAAQPV